MGEFLCTCFRYSSRSWRQCCNSSSSCTCCSFDFLRRCSCSSLKIASKHRGIPWRHKRGFPCGIGNSRTVFCGLPPPFFVVLLKLCHPLFSVWLPKQVFAAPDLPCDWSKAENVWRHKWNVMQFKTRACQLTLIAVWVALIFLLLFVGFDNS